MTDEQLLIHRARPLDLPHIVAIEDESFADPWDLPTLEWILETCGEHFFVAHYRQQVVGFIAGALEDTGEERYGHICNFAVTGAFRRMGIGRKLVARAEHQFVLEGAAGVQLEVRVSNLSAQRFYEKNGYQDVFQIPQYYANSEDALVMMRYFRF